MQQGRSPFVVNRDGGSARCACLRRTAEQVPLLYRAAGAGVQKNPPVVATRPFPAGRVWCERSVFARTVCATAPFGSGHVRHACNIPETARPHHERHTIASTAHPPPGLPASAGSDLPSACSIFRPGRTRSDSPDSWTHAGPSVGELDVGLVSHFGGW